MSINVYPWPPVAPVKWDWHVFDPIERDTSMITGADYISATMRRRRMASIEVHGRRDGMAAGYMESLKLLLEGGIHAVRLSSQPINWHLDATREAGTRDSSIVTWEDTGDAVTWENGGSPLTWYSGTWLTGTTGTDAAGFAIITVTGLPPNRLVARPSEFVRLFTTSDGVVARVLAPAFSDASGVAVIRLHSALPAVTDVRVNLGAQDSGVFRPDSLPRAAQPVSGDWTYRWELYEIFADEVDGGFTEVAPW